jgi:hypothetical protein
MSRKRVIWIEIAFISAVPVWATFLGFCAGLAPDPFSTVYLLSYFHLLTGWAVFLWRVVPNVAIDWFGVVLALASLAGLAGGMHYFCVWLHREIALKKNARDPKAAETRVVPGIWRLRSTLSILGIVVLLFVAGIAAVGSVHQLVWLRTRP